MSDDADPVRPGAVIAGKYRLEEPLARGGMGSVWRARHVDLDVQVAVKFMDAAVASTEAGRARFEREAKSAAQIQSPHVVQIHDYGVHEGTPYIAMELLSGEDLKARLDRVGRLPLPEAAAILGQVARGLGKAHRMGIVHRDLKPANIFLAGDEDGLVVKVLDFGVAKVSLPATKSKFVTRGGVVLGSIHFMSPEQARGAREIDHRADLWSLGVIAFRAVTGQQPFDLDPEDPTRAISLLGKGPRLDSPALAALGPAAEAFFRRALAPAPADRFQSARELAEAFTALAGAEGAIDPPPGSGGAHAPGARDGADASLPLLLARPKEGAREPTTVADTVPEADPRSRAKIVLTAVGGAALLALAVVAARWAMREAEPEPVPIALTGSPVVQIAPDPVQDAGVADAAEDAEARGHRSGLRADEPPSAPSPDAGEDEGGVPADDGGAAPRRAPP
jgi:serine/threonine-protein kinase